MKRLTQLLATAMLGLALAHGPVHAQTGTPDMSEMTDGEIRRVDKAAGKLTIKHAEIKSLDMPGMTMVFTARDPALLEPLQVGDKVRFAVVSEGGKMVVTAIQTVK